MFILTVNAGSSSLRLELFERRGAALAQIAADHHEGEVPERVITDLLRASGGRVDRVVHRIVHGGRRRGSSVIDAAVEREIESFAPMAPLHNPPALRWLRACRRLLGGEVPQVAVFDTAFFADLPEVAARYALPSGLCREHGIRRYGFHGIAHRAMWQRWCDRRPGKGGRAISLQLGAGCSVAAVADGRALDTSMGFTPLEGLVMATRSGDVDPGLITYLQRRAGIDAEAIERMLTRESGLAGLSGVGGDMRVVLTADTPEARLAVDLFCYRARKYIGAYLAVLGGADAILFGGGIGEHSPEVRSRILEGLEGLGVALDAPRNERARGEEAMISADDSRVAVWVIPVNEGVIMAQEAADQRPESGDQTSENR